MDSPPPRHLQRPTHSNLKVATSADAKAALFLVECGQLYPVHRRPDDAEKALISHGQVFVWLDGAKGETGLERWTDGRSWGPSRCRDDFLIYEEKTGDRKLTKSTYTARRNTTDGTPDANGRTILWHLIAYYFADELHTLVDMYADPSYRPYTSKMAAAYFVSNRKDKSRKAKEIPPPVPPSDLSRYAELVASVHNSTPHQHENSHSPEQIVSGGGFAHLESSTPTNTAIPIPIPANQQQHQHQHQHHQNGHYHQRTISGGAGSPYASPITRSHQSQPYAHPNHNNSNHHSPYTHHPHSSIDALRMTTLHPSPSSPSSATTANPKVIMAAMLDRLPSPRDRLVEQYEQISLEAGPGPEPRMPMRSANGGSHSHRPHLRLVTAPTSGEDGAFGLPCRNGENMGSGRVSSSDLALSSSRHPAYDTRQYAPSHVGGQNYHHPNHHHHHHRLPTPVMNSSVVVNGGVVNGNGVGMMMGHHGPVHGYSLSSPDSASSSGSRSPGLSPTPTTSSASAPSPIDPLPPTLGLGGGHREHRHRSQGLGQADRERERDWGERESDRERERESRRLDRERASPYSIPNPHAHSHGGHGHTHTHTHTKRLSSLGSVSSSVISGGGGGIVVGPREPYIAPPNAVVDMMVDDPSGAQGMRMGMGMMAPVPIAAVAVGSGTPSRSLVDEQQLHQLSKNWGEYLR